MSRPIRVEFEDAAYHLTARGNEQRAIYRDDQDRCRFLETVGEACERFGLVIHAYCLMPNHWHILGQTPRANLSVAVGWIQATYSIRFNRRHKRSGHLFQGRFKAHLIEADAYAHQLVKYIHLNPVRPKDKRKLVPVDRRSELEKYRWSSHKAYAGRSVSNVNAPWLCLDWLSHFGRTRRLAQREYRRQVAVMFGQVAQSPFVAVRDGLILGGEGLWQKAMKLIEGANGDEEIRWQERASRALLTDWIDGQVRAAGDRKVQIWLRVCLGGEGLTEVAKAYGYRDASGVHRVIQRLEHKACDDEQLRRRLHRYRLKLSKVKR